MPAARTRVAPWVGAALLVLACRAPHAARADSWQPAEFTGPGGRPARGLATGATGTPGARLLIGCDGDTADAWRGVVVRREGTGARDPREAEVVVSFFGRTPVTERWQRRADESGGVMVWPANGETLRRNLLREDTTRGRASLTLEIREAGASPTKLVFALDGLAERSPEIGATCAGWGAESTHKRRERGW